jgi:ADP-dependent NAD(P)H-hydrate dehydratase
VSETREHDSPSLPRLPPRRPESHKGDFGRDLLIGGSLGMTGAISMAGKAALRSGAGLVHLAVADVCLPIVATFEPAYMTSPLTCDDAGRISAAARPRIEELAKAADAVGCGPGLGRSPALTELVGWLYTTLRQPAVFDADALNALAQQPDLLCKPGGPRVLTPHPGEFGRLIAASDKFERAQMEAKAVEAAADWGVVVLLKGHRTLITDGRRRATNTTGNPGMATGGTGDVLTGIITGLLGQKLTAFEAAQLGAHVHGLAGDLAAAELGEVSLIASDLLDYLPAAFRSC